MRIAIPVKGPKGEEMLDNRFGRCERFLFVNTENDSRTTRENEARNMGGAGIMAAQTVVSEQVDVLITPDLGPNAFKVISSAGVDVYKASRGTVEQLLKELEEGKLERARSATVAGHHL